MLEKNKSINDSIANSSLLKKMDEYHYHKLIDEQNDYQNNATKYINQKFENSMKKDYNPVIVNLYKKGIIVIKKEEYQLRDFFIVFDSILNNYELKCINPQFKNKKINYDRAIRFIDTTAFINLINSSKIVDNKIIVDNEIILNNIINNWDGNIHNEVLETDSIINKKMT